MRVRGVGEQIEPLAFHPRSPGPPTPCSLHRSPWRLRLVYQYAWDRVGRTGQAAGPGDLEPAARAPVEAGFATAWRDRAGGRRRCRVPVLAGGGGTWFVPACLPGRGGPASRARGQPQAKSAVTGRASASANRRIRRLAVIRPPGRAPGTGYGHASCPGSHRARTRGARSRTSQAVARPGFRPTVVCGAPGMDDDRISLRDLRAGTELPALVLSCLRQPVRSTSAPPGAASASPSASSCAFSCACACGAF